MRTLKSHLRYVKKLIFIHLGLLAILIISSWVYYGARHQQWAETGKLAVAVLAAALLFMLLVYNRASSYLKMYNEGNIQENM